MENVLHQSEGSAQVQCMTTTKCNSVKERAGLWSTQSEVEWAPGVWATVFWVSAACATMQNGTPKPACS